MQGSSEVGFARLADWVEGYLSAAESEAVEGQVAEADEETLADVAWLHAFARVSESVVLPSPPPEVHSALVEHFEACTAGQRQPGLIRRFLTTLTFDSDLQPAVGGVRAAGTLEPERQFIYASDISDLALNIQLRPQDKKLDLDGQVFPNSGDVEPGFFSVQLLRGEDEYGMTTTDELGVFAFEAIPPDVYEMLLTTDRYEISVAPIELSV